MNKVKFITIAVISTLSICINSTSAMNNNIKKENHKNPKTNSVITNTNNINSNSINLNNTDENKENKSEIKKNLKKSRNYIENNFNKNKENLTNLIRSKTIIIPSSHKINNNINLNSINLNSADENKEKSKIKENLDKLKNYIEKNNFNKNKEKSTNLTQNKTIIIPSRYKTNNNQYISIKLNFKKLIKPKKKSYNSSIYSDLEKSIFSHCRNKNENYETLNKEDKKDEQNTIEIKEIDKTINKISKNFKEMINKLRFLIQHDVDVDYDTARNITFKNPITLKYETFCAPESSEVLFTNLIYSLINNIITHSADTMTDAYFHFIQFQLQRPFVVDDRNWIEDDLSEMRLIRIKANYKRKLFEENNLTKQKIERLKKERTNEYKEYINQLKQKIKNLIFLSKDETISKYRDYLTYKANIGNNKKLFLENFENLKSAIKKYKKIIETNYKNEELKEQINKKFKEYIEHQNNKKDDNKKDYNTGLGFLNFFIKHNQIYLEELKNKKYHKGEIEKNNELLGKINCLQEKGNNIIEKENKDITEKDLIDYYNDVIDIGEKIGEFRELNAINLMEENDQTITNLDNMILEGIKKTFENRKIEIPEEAFDIK